MKIMRLIVSLGSAVAAAKAVKQFTDFGTDDLLDYVGLERRSSGFWSKLAYFGVGAVAGAGVSLLLAPASGKETRQKLGKGVDKLATKASEMLEEAKEQAPQLMSGAGNAGSGSTPKRERVGG